MKPPEPTIADDRQGRQDSTGEARRSGRTLLLAVVVGVVALASLSFRLEVEPHFVDESAFIAQSYYADLLLDGRRDDPAWLTYPAVDLPPLPKYLIGLTFRACGVPRPGPEAARAWYADTSRQFVGPAALLQARLPSVALGAVACLAVFGLGTLIGDRWVGLLAALAIVVNPLFRLHARRAMADVPAEAFLVLTESLGLWAWCRFLSGRGDGRTWAAVVACGVAGGLAVEAKLNGGLGLMVVGAWTILGLALPGVAIARKAALAGSFLIASIVAFVVFLALNPTLTARPTGPLPPGTEELAREGIPGRVAAVIDFRATVSETAKDQFPHNALTTVAEKIRAVAVQGFGRFGPFGPVRSDSTRRYDRSQDWGALLWGPLVILGLLAASIRGWHQFRGGEPPTGWALATLWAVALAVVTAFIPLAWDRYYLSIQAGNALAAAFGVVSLIDAVPGRGK